MKALKKALELLGTAVLLLVIMFLSYFSIYYTTPKIISSEKLEEATLVCMHPSRNIIAAKKVLKHNITRAANMLYETATISESTKAAIKFIHVTTIVDRNAVHTEELIQNRTDNRDTTVTSLRGGTPQGIKTDEHEPSSTSPVLETAPKPTKSHLSLELQARLKYLEWKDQNYNSTLTRLSLNPDITARGKVYYA